MSFSDIVGVDGWDIDLEMGDKPNKQMLNDGVSSLTSSSISSSTLQNISATEEPLLNVLSVAILMLQK